MRTANGKMRKSQDLALLEPFSFKLDWLGVDPEMTALAGGSSAKRFSNC
jgi:hypothetical protein